MIHMVFGLLMLLFIIAMALAFWIDTSPNTGPMPDEQLNEEEQYEQDLKERHGS